ncbi:uncharacterized protein LOC133845550 [Drosophila sulfurigaster albostrigata]|uniref:uncharacterized protein LOC133845550 n=1 Tax=Drosophila sulfurigaster albostrigata TaxID=89887 RepID=UPI002D218EC7|nr:uncharacterized protein LOC133845550 [Drosophila sulfurigaster albostrigata]
MAVPHWMKIGWNDDIQQKMFRDWGIYYSFRRLNDTAIYYYDNSLQISPNNYMTLYRRSQSHRKAALIESALVDARKAGQMAMKSRGPNVNINLEICSQLFELNQFEASKVELQNNLKFFKGNEAQSFRKRLTVVNDVIEDVTGKAMSLFFLRNQKLIQRVNEITKAKAIKDKRPLWRRLRDQGKCDVVSIPEIEEEILSPLEIARRRLAFKVVHQTYMNNSWYDILFMKLLRKNPSLLLEQCKRSKEVMEDISTKQYEIVRQFMKMLQSRSPLYLVKYLKSLEKNNAAYFFRIQLQTHRNMISDLRQIRKMRKEKKIEKLSDYVEKIMSQYYVKKTNRVMCWKFEFINEVYNILALALSDQYCAPKKFNVDGPSALLDLLKLPNDKTKDITPFVFGDRSTYQEGTDQDIEGRKFRKLLTHFELRIRFAKFHIEKCYLYHQVASKHLSQGHYDECCFYARLSIKESRECNNALWNFLSIMLIVKANTVQYKVERTKEALDMAVDILEHIDSPELNKFIDLCLHCNEEEYLLRLLAISSRISKTSKASSVYKNDNE